MAEVHIHTTLTEEQYEILRLVAEMEHCRRADIIQRALREYLNQHAAPALTRMAQKLREKSSS